ncbi:MAG: HlyD family efflux transporter periplasmic adaptor subunit [Blastocatellia bacterium]|nr:HlyD family efflux transporter periplasmic adaptor subunit [Blastocatellia bacterium]
MGTDTLHEIHTDGSWQPESLKLAKMPHSARPLALVILLLLLTITVSLIYVPWQQSVSGAGRVIIYSPMERPQNIESPIPGRLVKWNVYEGQLVKSQEPIAELAEVDSKFLDRNQLERMKSQKRTLQTRLEAAELRAQALESQISSLGEARENAIPSADERVKQAGDRLRAAEQALEAAKQNLTTAELNLARVKELNSKGLRSNRDRELVELDYVRAVTEVERAEAAVEVAKRDTTVGQFDRNRLVGDTAASINSARASLAATKETIASINNDILKLDIEIQNMTERISQRVIYAPRDGRIVRLLKVGAGETVKAGDVLAVIAPDTNDLAVDFIVSDNDTPLVSVGRPVRLQFAGWPAIQFSGWPSIAVGTFAGRVTAIDAVDDGKSRYRMIITPDQEAIKSGKDEPWPSSQYLRPGAQVVGFIMLDTVSLGFELWRQFNAFPPTVQRPAMTDKKEDKEDKDKEEEKK